MKKQCVYTVKNERGTVLLTVLVMLVLLSILGAMSISTSTTEMELSGNYRRERTAYYNADAGIEYAMVSANIYTTIGSGTYSETRTVDDGNSSTSDYAVQVNVEFLSTGGLPPGTGTMEGEMLGANYYSATATGNGPNNTQVVLEAQYAKLVPK